MYLQTIFSIIALKYRLYFFYCKFRVRLTKNCLSGPGRFSGSFQIECSVKVCLIRPMQDTSSNPREVAWTTPVKLFLPFIFFLIYVEILIVLDLYVTFYNLRKIFFMCFISCGIILGKSHPSACLVFRALATGQKMPGSNPDSNMGVSSGSDSTLKRKFLSVQPLCVKDDSNA